MYTKIIIFFFLFLFSNFIYSQFDYGIKAGFQTNSSGDFENTTNEITSLNYLKKNTSGYFLGTYVSLDLAFFYFRPEIQFSYLNQNFESFTLSQSRLEAPLSLGFKLLPLVSTFAGPTFHLNFNPKIENISLSSLEKETSIGIHLGIRLHLGRINADIRYDRGLNANESTLLEQNGLNIFEKIDLRPNIWSLGLSYRM